MAFSMNPQRDAHMRAGMGESHEEEHGHKKPHIHIHHAGGKVHVHVMSDDQEPEVHEHDESDHDGIMAHVQEHYGSGEGADENQEEEAPGEVTD